MGDAVGGGALTIQTDTSSATGAVDIQVNSRPRRSTLKSLDLERGRIAHEIRGLRLERRWTQAELAGRLGLSQSRLSEIERGDGSRFLALIKERHPQHFAMVALGFATGLRPSSLRPLRRQGPQADVLGNDSVLLVRRSQACGHEVMECTKQGTRYRLTLPQELMDILRWHVEQLPEGPMRESELLFPSTVGGFRTTNVFKKVFDDVCRVMGLKKKISARAMRRTFQDLAREANIDKFVQRSICGHSTEEMSQLYSTVGQKEIERAVGKVISMAGYRRLTLSGPEGDALGMHGENGPSERQPGEAIGEPTGRLTN